MYLLIKINIKNKKNSLSFTTFEFCNACKGTAKSTFHRFQTAVVDHNLMSDCGNVS